MSDTDDRLREVLIDYSDHRASRAVWAQVTGDHDADVADLVETMRVTNGAVAVAGHEDAADVYARWTGGSYEYLTLWPPWTIGGYDRADRADLAAVLSETTGLRPVLHEDTPFADGEVLTAMSHRIWP